MEERKTSLGSIPTDVTLLYSPKYYAACAIGGSLACSFTHLITVPLDIVKCNMQAEPTKFVSSLQTFRHLKEQHGLRGLSLGWVPTAVGYGVQGIFRFGLYEYFKHEISVKVDDDNFRRHRTTYYLASAASAEFVADLFLCPFEAMKVRIQTNPAFATTMRTAFPKMLQQEGVAGFYKGLVPLWCRQIPYTMVKFATFEKTVDAMYEHLVPKPREECSTVEQLSVTFAAGYTAGALCALVSHPADTVISKLNKRQSKDAVGNGLVSTVREIGFRGIWKGFVPRLFMISTIAALQWYIYDGFKMAMGLPSTGNRGNAGSQHRAKAT